MESPNQGCVTHFKSPWDNYDKSDDGMFATCKTCKKHVKTKYGNTSGLHYHLSTHKMSADKNKRKMKVNLESAELVIPAKRINVGEDLATDQSLKAILARITSRSGLSFKVFQTDEDLRLCLNARMIQLHSEERMPATDKTVKAYVMQFFARVKEAVKENFKVLKRQGIKFSLTFDEWTSGAHKRYINVIVFTCHKMFWSLGLIRITGSATAERIMELVLERLEEFGINYNDDIVGITTDGAAVMVKLGRDESNAEHQLCLIHGIHLAVVDVLYVKENVISAPSYESTLDQNSLENLEETDQVESTDSFTTVDTDDYVIEFEDADIKVSIGKLRQVGRWFNKSAKSMEKLQEYVKAEFGEELSLFVDTKTRWNSLYDMIERYWKIKHCVDKTLIDIDSDLIINAQDKCIFEVLLVTLKPVKAVVELFSQRHYNLNKAFAALKVLFADLQNQSHPLTQRFVKRLCCRMTERFNNTILVLRYLSTGHYDNDFPQPNPVASKPNSSNNLPTTSSSSKVAATIEALDANSKKPRSDISKLFDIPHKRVVRTHILDIINRLFYNSEDTVVQPVPIEINLSVQKSFEELLDEAMEECDKSVGVSGAADLSEIGKLVTAEMNHFEKTGERTGFLIKVFDSLMTIQASSVESERAFSLAASICTKIRSRLNDSTLDALCFLKSFFKNPCIYNHLENQV